MTTSILSPVHLEGYHPLIPAATCVMSFSSILPSSRPCPKCLFASAACCSSRAPEGVSRALLPAQPATARLSPRNHDTPVRSAQSVLELRQLGLRRSRSRTAPGRAALTSPAAAQLNLSVAVAETPPYVFTEPLHPFAITESSTLLGGLQRPPAYFLFLRANPLRCPVLLPKWKSRYVTVSLSAPFSRCHPKL